MAAINTVAKEWAGELRDGIAWLIVWKTGRSWNAQAVWLNPDNDTFELEDLEMARKVLEQDPKAIMINGYYCGHFGEDMAVAELAAGIRWHYENGYNLLKESSAFPQEPMERPEESLATSIQSKTTSTDKMNQQQEQNGCATPGYFRINGHSNRQDSKLQYRYFLPLLLPSGVRGPPIIKNQRKSKLFRGNPNHSEKIRITQRKSEFIRNRRVVNIWTD